MLATSKKLDYQWLQILRRSVAVLVVLLTVLILLMVFLYQWLPVRQLQWSGVSIGSQQIRVAALSFGLGQVQQGWEVQLKGLEIGWRGWPLPWLKAQQLQLRPVLPAVNNAPSSSAMTSATTEAQQLPAFPVVHIPDWLPQRIEIPHLMLQLPCQSRPQFCQLQGELQSIRLQSAHQAEQTQLALQMQRDGQHVRLQLSLESAEQVLQQLNIEMLAVQLDVKALADGAWIPGLPAGLLPDIIQLQLSGVWQAEALRLNLLAPLVVNFRVQPTGNPVTGFVLPAVELTVASGQLDCLSLSWQQCQINLNASAFFRQLTHPLLQPSDWTWHGQAVGTLAALKLNGVMKNPQSLQVTYDAELSPSAVKLQWQLADIFLLAGNPLQITKLWPALLELQGGKITAQGQFQLQLPQIRMAQIQLTAQLKELKGVYDRTTFAGLSTELLLEGDPKSFVLQLPKLKLSQLQHGFQAGPAQLDLHYRADWSAPTHGEVRLAEAQLGMFGGQLTLALVQFQLQQPTVEFQLGVHQIQLAALLQQHPSAQLMGDGIISGTIPLRYQQVVARQSNSEPTQSANSALTADPQRVSDKHSVGSSNSSTMLAQWQVLGGSLAAEPPGGRLQYQTQAVAGQPPSGMDIAWQALSDFRYQTLASTVELQPDGKVLLQVKLHGFNPKLQQGRPVHFNINLEEDLPALLTSLQLSGQISDKVRQRIQAKLQQQALQKAGLVNEQLNKQNTQQNTQPKTQQKPAAKSAIDKSQ